MAAPERSAGASLVKLMDWPPAAAVTGLGELLAVVSSGATYMAINYAFDLGVGTRRAN
ncbi:hypothetical protein [Micromonospora aurantiaca (nom. illeg.)]|uniref:hypothetical protein n=1 Tax=Micromonospora aurantiaca (nom. illeg.) TaxID=47850 RepID=UPI00161D0D5D